MKKKQVKKNQKKEKKSTTIRSGEKQSKTMKSKAKRPKTVSSKAKLLKIKPSRSTKQKIPKTANIIGIIGIVVAIVVGFIEISSKKPFIFIIENSILKKGEKIFIKSGNSKTDREESIQVKFDGFVYINAGRPLKKEKKSVQRWVFDLKRHDIPPGSLNPGKHSICFAFEGRKFSDPQNIYISSDQEGPTSQKSKSNWFLALIYIVLGAVIIITLIWVVKKILETKIEKDHPDNNGYPGL